MPGVGTCDPSRNSTMMPSVKSSFLRRSGVRNARTKAASTGSSWGPHGWRGVSHAIRGRLTQRRSAPGSLPRLPTSRRLAVGARGAGHTRCVVVTRGLLVASGSVSEAGRSAREGRDRAARGLDLLLGGGGELVRVHLDLHGDLARAEDLHREAVADG